MINDDSKATYQPRYDWRDTVDCEGMQDYCSWDGEVQFGHILKDNTSLKKGQWIWAINYIPWQKRAILPHHGWEARMSEAIRQVEELYDKLKELHGR